MSAEKTTKDTTVEQSTPQVQPVQQVQYVTMEKSLKGVGGWLIFWIIMFSLAAIGYISAFFASMMSLSNAASIVTLIFAPILAAGFITSVVMIAMQKRIGKLVTFITLGVSAVYALINSIVGYLTVGNAAGHYSYSASSSVEKSIPMLIASILISLLVHALVALYFVLSRRVKETLVN